MTEAPNPQRVAADRLPRGPTDLLADVVQRVRLKSAVFLRGEFSAPWALLSTDSDTLAMCVRPGAKRLVLFHVVVEGGFHIELASGERAWVQAGDAVVLPYCDVHHMGHPADATRVPFTDLVPMPPWMEMPVVKLHGGGEPTRILCGYLHCEDMLFNPVLNALPRLIHVRPTSESAAQWRQVSLRYVAERANAAGGDAALEALPELVFMDCLLQYVAGLTDSDRGFLGALKDPVVGRVLVLLHAQPETHWTVERLASEVAVSRSVLAQRFTDVLGVSPMKYLTQWRLQMAADLLRTTSMGVAAIAARVGYVAEPAFSRAFKRELGLSPAAWREGGRTR